MPYKSHQPIQFALPERIHRLGDLAYNLWWTWQPDAQDMFQSIDPVLWQASAHNPVVFLRDLPPLTLQTASMDLNFTEQYDRVVSAFDAYIKPAQSWFSESYASYTKKPIAYFSSEFGLHETLPIYAGGLGILAGDHLKEASDLGLPLVAVGFLYTHGYFFQHISEDGWQESRPITLKFEEMPVLPVADAEGKPLMVSIELPGRSLQAKVWEIRVGRVPLYLLDSNVEENNPADRELTARLYSSDLDLRISQEMLLGIGGVRTLRTLGYNPTVWHMNEGHSAFLGLEQARELVQGGLPISEAIKRVRMHNVFTTHTPVPAGNDEFPIWLVDRYFSNYWAELGLDQEGFIKLAHQVVGWGEAFSMPVLAMRFSAQHNGVSELHGEVARNMWSGLWPKLAEDQVPIGYITNGIHTQTWLSKRMGQLYNKHLGDWRPRLDEAEAWQKIHDIPNKELWRARRHAKRKLAFYVRERVRRQWLHEGIHPVQVVAGGALLDPYALTIGFARRFATYKRANLVLQDLERLIALLNKPDRPVQILFAGKAHPADEGGKQLIQEVYRAVKKAETGGRLVFLEGYDMELARYLVQGVDVWLNTPRRPMEASGTSGQKAALNGALNFSILDGWWSEGYNGKNGWAIGSEQKYSDPAEQDLADAHSLYSILENEIIPLYYEGRSGNQHSDGWLAMVKESISTLGPQFSARRMLKEYVDTLYVPAMEGRVDVVEIG
ncbi:MAG: alpha-glucan family phosphorylase [Anaerolineales bacterium]|nr:MAG: alpha-glucan family phosphorylase [Anaerolineales bacterium]